MIEKGKKTALLWVFFMGFGCLSAQNITQQQTYWLRVYARIKFNADWALHFEADNRRFFETHAPLQQIFHLHVHRKTGAHTDLGLGLTQSTVWQNSLAVPEWRPFVEANWSQNITQKWRISHRLRFDARFFHNYSGVALTEGYNWKGRLRYLLRTDYAPSPRWTLKANGELMYHTDDFDQYRYYWGVDYRFGQHNHIEIGYLKVYQKRNNNKGYFDRDNLRITLLKDFYL